ncbi:MAG TPA: hypothetical protein VGT05_01900 [Patescibacteria group bacterium]|nr:hypothetical protein [Patescibacteria group bacterium]
MLHKERGIMLPHGSKQRVRGETKRVRRVAKTEKGQEEKVKAIIEKNLLITNISSDMKKRGIW